MSLHHDHAFKCGFKGWGDQSVSCQHCQPRHNAEEGKCFKIKEVNVLQDLWGWSKHFAKTEIQIKFETWGGEAGRWRGEQGRPRRGLTRTTGKAPRLEYHHVGNSISSAVAVVVAVVVFPVVVVVHVVNIIIILQCAIVRRYWVYPLEHGQWC